MQSHIERLIRETGGRFFGVSFIKRTTGEVRHMTARLGVTKHLRGGAQAYDPRQHDLVTVFDVEKKDYRSIPLDGVFSFACGAKQWRST